MRVCANADQDIWQGGEVGAGGAAGAGGGVGGNGLSFVLWFCFVLGVFLVL